MPRFVFSLVAGFLLVSGLVAGEPTDEKSNAVEPVPDIIDAPIGGDFTLMSKTGQVSLSDYRGKAVLITFGYSHCPDVCPMTLFHLARALNGVEVALQEQVQGIFITLDPERDTIEVLHEYVRYFHESIVGLGGTIQAINKVARLYGVRYSQVELLGSDLDYSISHSAATYLINPQGVLQFIFPYLTPATVMTEAAQYVLSQASQ